MKTTEELLHEWQAGPYVNELGLIVVPLHPRIKRNWYPWEALGFRFDGVNALVRSVTREHNGKQYGAQSWLTSTWRKFQEFYPEWSGTLEMRISPPLRDPLTIAQRLYQVFGGEKAAAELWGKGYPAYAFAGAIKNQFGVSDQQVRRHLQALAQQTYTTLEQTYGEATG